MRVVSTQGKKQKSVRLSVKSFDEGKDIGMFTRYSNFCSVFFESK